MLEVLVRFGRGGYTCAVGADLHRTGLSDEAIRLTRAVRSLLPGDSEVSGLLALMLLVDKHSRGDDSQRERIHRAYLDHARYINNWDLVDASAGEIVGSHLGAADISLLEQLASSANIWERRIAIVSTFHFIKLNEFRPTLQIARLLVGDSHDLIHKAVGWMLREVGKRDRRSLDTFLRKHYRKMPRTMLRYAIQRHPERVRKQYPEGPVCTRTKS